MTDVTVIDGVLDWFVETGTAGVRWVVTTDHGAARRSHRNLYILRDGDHLTVYREDGSVRWSGVIDFEYESNWVEYPLRLRSGAGQQTIAGWWVHGVQRRWLPEDWADLFWGHDIAMRGVRTAVRPTPLRATLVRGTDASRPFPRPPRS